MTSDPLDSVVGFLTGALLFVWFLLSVCFMLTVSDKLTSLRTEARKQTALLEHVVYNTRRPEDVAKRPHFDVADLYPKPQGGGVFGWLVLAIIVVGVLFVVAASR